jgi:hypothetical protein
MGPRSDLRHCRGCDGWFPRSSFNGAKNCSECKANPRPRKGLLPIEILLGGNAAYDEMRSLARQRAAETGISHDVDHIVPFWGKPTRPGLVAICGLHIPSNFRVIPSAENQKDKRWFFTEHEARAEEARLMEIAMSGTWVE